MLPLYLDTLLWCSSVKMSCHSQGGLFQTKEESLTFERKGFAGTERAGFMFLQLQLHGNNPVLLDLYPRLSAHFRCTLGGL
eukprot:570840-Pelagomonas_calceolata.AAC.7